MPKYLSDEIIERIYINWNCKDSGCGCSACGSNQFDIYIDPCIVIAESTLNASKTVIKLIIQTILDKLKHYNNPITKCLDYKLLPTSLEYEIDKLPKIIELDSLTTVCASFPDWW